MGGDGTSGSGATPDPGEIERTARELLASRDAYVRREMGAAPGAAPPAGAPAAGRLPHEVSLPVDSAETDRVVGQLLDQVVAGAPTPSPTPKPTVDDIAAYVGLVELSQPAPSLPEAGPVGSPRRLGRLLLLSGFAGLVGIFLLLAVMQARPGGETPAPVAPPVDAAQPAGDAEPADGAGGDAGQPVDAQPGGAVIPTSCLVPQGGALDLELTDVTWKEATDGLSFSWRVLIHNRGSEAFSVFLHDVAGANAASRAQSGVDPTEWQAGGGNVIEPDGKVLPNGNALPINSESGGGQTSVEPGMPTHCSWGYVDRLVAVYSGPECRDAIWARLKAASDAVAREAILGPLAIDMPIPDQMRAFSCPE